VICQWTRAVWLIGSREFTFSSTSLGGSSTEAGGGESSSSSLALGQGHKQAARYWSRVGDDEVMWWWTRNGRSTLSGPCSRSEQASDGKGTQFIKLNNDI
jgi:hypothetical protein